MGNIYHQQTVTERHPNLVLKFVYLKDLDDVSSFNISGVEGGKESEQVKLGINVIVIIIYKHPFVVNGQPVTVSLAQG